MPITCHACSRRRAGELAPFQMQGRAVRAEHQRHVVALAVGAGGDAGSQVPGNRPGAGQGELRPQPPAGESQQVVQVVGGPVGGDAAAVQGAAHPPRRRLPAGGRPGTFDHAAVDLAQLAQRAGRHARFGGVVGFVETAARRAAGGDPVALGGQHRLHLGRVQRGRLLDQHVLAGFERTHGELRPAGRMQGQHHRLDPRIADQLLRVEVGPSGAEFVGRLLRTPRQLVGNRGERGLRGGGRGAQVDGADHAAADHAEPHRAFHADPHAESRQ